MKIKLFLLVIVAMSLFVSSCSRAGKNDSANAEEVIMMDDLSPEEREKILSRSGINLKENKTLADNLSRIEISRDNFGIKIEKQYYNNLPNIDHIAIHTFANGQKQIIIYGQNGSVRSLSENMMSEIIKASPDELTREAPVYNNAENQNPNGGITIKTLPPVTSAQAEPLPVNTPLVEATPPPAAVEEPKETKQETQPKPQELPAAKATPTEAATKNLQLYPTKKKVNNEK